MGQVLDGWDTDGTDKTDLHGPARPKSFGLFFFVGRLLFFGWNGRLDEMGGWMKWKNGWNRRMEEWIIGKNDWMIGFFILTILEKKYSKISLPYTFWKCTYSITFLKNENKKYSYLPQISQIYAEKKLSDLFYLRKSAKSAGK